MKKLINRLTAVDVVTLLGSLPYSYSTLVIAVEARVVISLSYVQQSLINEEQRMKESGTLHLCLDNRGGINRKARILDKLAVPV